MLYLTISPDQSVLGLIGLSGGGPGFLNKIVDFGGPKGHLNS